MAAVALGSSVWAGSHWIPAGSGARGSLVVVVALVTAGAFWAVLVVAAGLAAALPRLAACVDTRLREIPVRERAQALRPVMIGLALPALAVLLAPLSFRPLTSALGWIGVAIGGLMSAWRLTALAQSTGRPARDRALTIATLAVLVGLVALTGWPSPQGDEPHHLLVAHSIWEDGDLDVADEYGAGAYRPFHPTALSPHYKPGLAEGSRYSMHGVGYALLLLPAYTLGRMVSPTAPVVVARGFQLILFGLCLICLYRLVDEIAGRRAALGAALASGITAPLLLAPLHLFPETAAMTFGCAAVWLLTRRAGAPASWCGAGLLLAVLPWLGVKYIPLALVLAAVAPWAGRAVSPLRATLLACAPVALGLALHGWFTWSLYGSLSPAALYLGADPDFGRQAGYGADWAAYLRDWPVALRTLAGFFADQKEGLLAVGPHFLLAAIGFPWLLRTQPRLALLLLLAVAAHLGPYALSQQAGGHSPPARPIMPVAWCLAVPLGVALSTPVRGLAALLMGALPVVSMALLGAFLVDPSRLPHDYGIEASRLLRELSPFGIEIWRAFPLLISRQPNLLVSVAWLLATTALGWILCRSAQGAPPSRRETRPALVPWTSATALVVLVGIVLAGQAQLVLTDRHVGRAIATGVEAWSLDAVPPRAYIEPGGVWVPPGPPVELVLTSSQPLERTRVWLRTLVPSTVTFEIEGQRVRSRVEPAAPLAHDLAVRGRADGDRWVYRVRLGASEGGIPALLEGGGDQRVLGVNLRLERIAAGRLPEESW